MGHPEVQGPAPKSVSTGQNFPHNCWPLPPLRTQNGAGILLRAGRNAKDHHQAFPGPHSRPRCRAWQSWVGGDRRRQMPPLGASGGDSLPPRPPPSWCHLAQRESPGGLDSDVGPGPCPRFRLSHGGTRGAAATSAPAKMPALDVTTPRDIVLMHVFTPEHSRPTESQSPKAEPDDAQAPPGVGSTLDERFSECGHKTGSVGVAWRHVRDAESQAPPQTCRIRDSGAGAPPAEWFRCS